MYTSFFKHVQTNKMFLHGENCTSKIAESVELENDLRKILMENRRIGRIVESENDFRLNLRGNRRIRRIVECETTIVE